MQMQRADMTTDDGNIDGKMTMSSNWRRRKKDNIHPEVENIRPFPLILINHIHFVLAKLMNKYITNFMVYGRNKTNEAMLATVVGYNLWPGITGLINCKPQSLIYVIPSLQQVDENHIRKLNLYGGGKLNRRPKTLSPLYNNNLISI